MKNTDKINRDKEIAENNVSFLIKFIAVWLTLLLGISIGGWFIFGITFGLSSIIIIPLLSALIALLITPFLGVYKSYKLKEIDKLKNNGDVLKLLRYIHNIGLIDTVIGSIWDKATSAIIEIGKPAIPILIKALNVKTCPVVSAFGNRLKSNPNLRYSAAYCLGKIGDISIIENLIEAFSDNNKTVQKYVKEAFEELINKNDIDELNFANNKDRILDFINKYKEEKKSFLNDELIIHLKKLIDKEKNKNLFQKSSRKELIDNINKICQTKDDCVNLIRTYTYKFNSNLIDDLIGLSSSYDSIKENLEKFIDFKIIEIDYPHKLLVQI